MHSSDVLPIDFLVVGGSIAGLCAAIALCRVGHSVTVLDQSASYEEPGSIGAGCRLPPNATKILYRWGLEERLRACAIKSTGILFAQYHNGSVVGSHDWAEEVLEETGGDILLIHYDNLRRILAEAARQHGATLRTDAVVVDIHADPERPYVKLSTGEVLSADVVVGADGWFAPNCLSRTIMLKALGQPNTETFANMQCFNVMMSQDALDKLDDAELQQFSSTGKVFTWFSPTYGALGFPIRMPQSNDKTFNIVFYTRRPQRETPKDMSAKEQLIASLEGSDPRLATLAKEASRTTEIALLDRPFLEDWVHPRGRVIVIGDAAHPITAGSLYTHGMAVGDAAVLGRLFAHLHTHAQIARFLSAVRELRAPRVERVVRASAGNIFAVALPPGIAEARERHLRERAERGIQALGGAGTSEEMVQAIEGIFAYDPEDGADGWWHAWGLPEERAARIFEPRPVGVETVETHQVEASS